MPQMSPMDWFLLMFYFYFIYLILIVFIYFNFSNMINFNKEVLLCNYMLKWY